MFVKTGGIPLLKIAGIPVEINYSWILIFALVTANLALRWFPTVLPGRSHVLYYALSASGALILFACVLAHELSHSLVAKRAGSQVRGIILHVFGGVSLIEEQDYTPALELRVAIAGPILSLALGLFFLMLRRFVFPIENSIGYSMVTYLYFVNVMLAVFNLLPGFPLDGGRVLRALIGFWKKDLVISTRLASRVGVILSLVLMAYGLFVVLSGNFWGFWTLLIGMFLKDAADASYQQVLMRDVFQTGKVREIMQTNPVVVPPEIPIQQFIDDYLWHYHYGSFPVGDASAVGIITFNDVKKIPADRRSDLRVRDLIHPFDSSLEASPDDPIVAAFTKANTNGVGRLIVVDENKRIVGYISLRDITRVVLQRRELRGKSGS